MPRDGIKPSLSRANGEVKRTSDTTTPEPRPFHITIGAAGTPSFDIEADFRMLRTGLLYGDKVKLCSYSFSFLHMIYGLASTTEGFLEALTKGALLIEDKAEWARETAKIAVYRDLLRKNRRDRADLIALSNFRSAEYSHKQSLLERYPILKSMETEFRAIQEAIKKNILELHDYESQQFENLPAEQKSNDKQGETRGISNYEAYEELLKVLTDAMQNRATYPLFDNNAGLIVSSLINEGAVEASLVRIAQAKHSATAANMFERLPDFGVLPLDVVLSIRNELRQYLAPFRAGIKSYSLKIQSAPWSADFAPEADEVFIGDVLPAFLSLEESIKSNRSILKELKDSKTWLEASLGFGATNVFGLFVDDIGALPIYTKIGLGLTFPIATTLADWTIKMLKGSPEIKQHTLYFYYQLRDKTQRHYPEIRE